MNPEIIKFMKEFMTKIPNAEIYLVGGAVRDIVLNTEPHDFDFCTNVSVDEMEPHFNCVNIGQSKDFGITSIQYEGNSYEVATYRIDSKGHSDARHPDSVDFNATLENDLSRRDFTINSMAMDIDGNIIDLFGGQQDIKDRIIRAVGVAEDRINEDALRILRAIRFAVSFDFDIEDDLKSAIIKNFKDIEKLSQERITDEFGNKVASKGGKVFYKYFCLVEEFGGMKYLFPEIEVMKNYKQFWLHHPEGSSMHSETDGIVPLTIKAMEAGTHTLHQCGSVYDHMKSVLRCVPEGADEFTILGALWHDIGKPSTAEFKDDSTGTSSFKRHEYKGVAVFEELAKKRKIGGKLCECIKFCIKQHMNMNNKELSKKSKILELAMNPFFDTLAEVSRADDKSRNVAGNVLYVEEEFDKNLQKFLDARDTYVDNSALKAKIAEFVDGKKVMKICNIKPSRKVGIIIDHITEFLIDCDFNTSIETVDNHIEVLGKCKFTEDGRFDFSDFLMKSPPRSGAYDIVSGYCMT